MEITNGSKNGHLTNGRRYAFDNFEIDPGNRVLLRDGEAVPLTGKVFDVLLVFAENPGRLLEKDELIEKVWHSDFVEEGNLARNVSTLRKALGDTGKEHKYIATVQGRGYRFIANIAEGGGVAARISAEAEAQHGPNLELATAKDKAYAGFSTNWLWIVALAVLLTGAVWIGKYGFSLSSDARIRSIAVLPFVNAAPDASLEYLSDGMTEDLINDLSSIPELKVKSKNAVFTYKGKATDPQKVASDLAAGSILTGKINRVNDQLVIDVELTDAADNSQIWGQKFAIPNSEIIATQNAIALSVVHSLRLNLTDAEQLTLAKSKTANPEAYRLYLLGRFFWNKRTGPDMKKAVDYYNQAVAIDPNYGAAYSGLANCYALYSIYDLVPPDEAFPVAKSSAERALALDETLAEAHASLAFVLYHYDRDWAKAETEFKRAIELNPDYPTAHHWYGEYLGAEGRFDEAIAEQKMALRLDPLSFIINMDLGWNYYLARRDDEAVEQYRKALELEPNSSITHHTFSETYALEGRYEDSAREYFTALQADGFSGEEIEPLKSAFELGGFKRFVQSRILWKEKVYAKKLPPQLIDTAWDYAFLNEKDKAFEWLRKSLEKREADMVFLKYNPAYDNLHDDPRFAELIKQLGLR